MKYKKELALQIQKKFGVSNTTLRVWKMRGNIPKKYFEEKTRVTLLEIAKDSEISNPYFIQKIEYAKKKYGKELERLLESRKFKPDQNDGYYASCLYSLCRECKTYSKKGKLS